ncbi:uncharacterized protein LOC108732780 [Agrilus planipennis]|uniref:Uncharacterized protein LOC108732780 n=1 Tax=Agrilus planipennis TaxID=224129 RepID=A0A7F5R8W4_AGRPL|nr:uncharacterized protein LOC108732780 [Agrilus planipennis]
MTHFLQSELPPDDSESKILQKRPSIPVTSTIDIFSTSSVLIQKDIGKLKLKKSKRLLCLVCKNPPKYTSGEMELRLQRLQRLCLSHVRDAYRLHLLRLQGLELIQEFLQRARVNDLTIQHIKPLVWCAVSCLHHFYIRSSFKRGITPWIRRRQAKRATTIFEKVLQFLEMHRHIVIESALTFLTEGQVWYDEYITSETLKSLFDTSEQYEKGLQIILDNCLSLLPNAVVYADQILSTLTYTIKNHIWLELSDDLIERILNIYLISLNPENEENYLYAPMKECLESFVKVVLERISSTEHMKILSELIKWLMANNLRHELVLEFGNLIEHAAKAHSITFYYETLVEDVLLLVFKLIASETRSYSLLGNRIFQCLMDRGKNRSYFDTPKIFFRDIKYDIEVKECKSCDAYFIRRFRETIHDTFMRAVKNHGSYRLNLENVYRSICILIVEVPAGSTAATVVCLAMACQEYAISGVDLDMSYTNQIHATVISILSLVCWVNSADVFYDYLYSIMEKRAAEAPQLNPPLRNTYEYAEHHVQWLKLDLFFEDWEVRYGLWKRFKKSEKKRSTLSKLTRTGSSSLSLID